MTPLEHERTVRAFFLAHEPSFAAMCAAYKQFLGDDTLWRNAGFPDARGRVAAVDLLEATRKAIGCETIRIDVLELAATDNLVATERVDHLRRADGSIIVSIPVAGFMTFEGNRLASWREYADTKDLLAMMNKGATARTG